LLCVLLEPNATLIIVAAADITNIVRFTLEMIIQEVLHSRSGLIVGLFFADFRRRRDIAVITADREIGGIAVICT